MLRAHAAVKRYVAGPLGLVARAAHGNGHERVVRVRYLLAGNGHANGMAAGLLHVKVVYVYVAVGTADVGHKLARGCVLVGVVGGSACVEIEAAHSHAQGCGSKVLVVLGGVFQEVAVGVVEGGRAVQLAILYVGEPHEASYDVATILLEARNHLGRGLLGRYGGGGLRLTCRAARCSVFVLPGAASHQVDGARVRIVRKVAVRRLAGKVADAIGVHLLVWGNTHVRLGERACAHVHVRVADQLHANATAPFHGAVARTPVVVLNHAGARYANAFRLWKPHACANIAVIATANLVVGNRARRDGRVLFGCGKAAALVPRRIIGYHQVAKGDSVGIGPGAATAFFCPIPFELEVCYGAPRLVKKNAAAPLFCKVIAYGRRPVAIDVRGR